MKTFCLIALLAGIGSARGGESFDGRYSNGDCHAELKCEGQKCALILEQADRGQNFAVTGQPTHFDSSIQIQSKQNGFIATGYIIQTDTDSIRATVDLRLGRSATWVHNVVCSGLKRQ